MVDQIIRDRSPYASLDEEVISRLEPLESDTDITSEVEVGSDRLFGKVWTALRRVPSTYYLKEDRPFPLLMCLIGGAAVGTAAVIQFSIDWRYGAVAGLAAGIIFGLMVSNQMKSDGMGEYHHGL